jgi:hypothetical protein
MSDGELARLEVLRDLDQKRLTTKTAVHLLGLERRQVFRLLKAYRTEGATGLISRRGRPGNRRKPEALRRAALVLMVSDLPMPEIELASVYIFFRFCADGFATL